MQPISELIETLRKLPPTATYQIVGEGMYKRLAVFRVEVDVNLPAARAGVAEPENSGSVKGGDNYDPYHGLPVPPVR